MSDIVELGSMPIHQHIHTIPSSAIDAFMSSDPGFVQPDPDIDTLVHIKDPVELAIEAAAQSGMFVTATAAARTQAELISVAENTELSPAFSEQRRQILTGALCRRHLGVAALKFANQLFETDFITTEVTDSTHREHAAVDSDKVGDLFDKTIDFDSQASLVAMDKLLQVNQVDREVVRQASCLIRLVFSGDVDKVLAELAQPKPTMTVEKSDSTV